MTKKKLYIISLGPGDPELLTWKAIKYLLASEAIYIPVRDNIKDSRAYKIIMSIKTMFFDNNDILIKKTDFPILKGIPSPMKYDKSLWKAQLNELLTGFLRYECLAYVTLGDSAIFSRVYYLLEYLKDVDPELYSNTLVIPGITSFSYASAKMKKSLCQGMSSLEIRPWNNNPNHITKVIMKPKVGDALSNYTPVGDLSYIENLGFKNENISKDLPQNWNKYMSFIIDFSKKKIID